MSKRMKMINMFETTSPYDFIASKYSSGTPSNSDLKIISYLLLDLDLKPGVVNVLVDYVLKINNNKLTKSFIDTIASQWKKSNIETVEDAMDIAEKEYHSRQDNKVVKTTSSSNTKILESEPSWFKKDIEENSTTEEEIKAFEALLKGND
jgi:replication initiation and membrane attachment protein